jgi:hypothetical protein
MRWLRTLPFCLGILWLGLAGSARAATLGFTGTLTLSVIPQPWYLGPLTVNAATAGSGVALVNGSGGGSHLNSLAIGAGAFGPFSIASTWIGSASPTINSVRFTNIANLTGSFGPGLSGGPPGGGAMGLTGLTKICLVFAPCQFAGIVVPLSPTVGGAGFGIGGTHLTTPVSPIQLTLQHGPWTIGQPVMTIHSPNSNVTAPVLPGGFAHGPASLTSSTALSSAVIQLVTVTKVFTSITSGFPEFPVIGVLTLHFVPEPGTLLLLGTGVAVLAVVGRRRGRQ